MLLLSIVMEEIMLSHHFDFVFYTYFVFRFILISVRDQTYLLDPIAKRRLLYVEIRVVRRRFNLALCFYMGDLHRTLRSV